MNAEIKGIFHGEFIISKEELHGCRLTEQQIVHLYIERIERENNVKVGWYFKKESKSGNITYYYCEHGNSMFVQKRIKLLKKLSLPL